MTRSYFRKPSWKKSLKASTTGRMKRSIKRKIIPGYGKKGMGKYTNPKKYVYNKIYNRTSVDSRKMFVKNPQTRRRQKKNTSSSEIGCTSSLILLFVGLFLGQWIGGNIGGTIGVILMTIIIICSMFS